MAVSSSGEGSPCVDRVARLGIAMAAHIGSVPQVGRRHSPYWRWAIVGPAQVAPGGSGVRYRLGGQVPRRSRASATRAAAVMATATSGPRRVALAEGAAMAPGAGDLYT